MNRIFNCGLAVMAMGMASLTVEVARATVVWDIDQTQSKISLSIPNQNVDGTNLGFRNQTGSATSWTVGNTAFLNGTLVTDNSGFNNSSISFLAGSNIVGLNSGNYRPNPAAFNPGATSTANPDGSYTDTSTAPGVFGGRIVMIDPIVNSDAQIAFRDMNFDLASAALPVAFNGPNSRTVNTTGLQFGISDGSIDVDGLSIILVGQLIPDARDLAITNAMGSNSNPNGAIDLVNQAFRLTIPLNIPITIDIDGSVFNATITGQIVAFPTPEPSTLLMGSVGLVASTGYARRRRRRS